MNLDDSYEVDELPALPRKEITPEDRQLLDLAARAIGAIRVEEIDGEGILILHFQDRSPEYGWNPLVHSDDALRLSVWLEIDVNYRVVGGRRVEAVPAGLPVFAEPYSGDGQIAAKRAIVRAAAEIGKAIP